MNKPSYKIETSTDGLWYEFISDGHIKSIKKGVGYYLYEENSVEYAELAFGDILPNGSIDIKAISDNQDMVLVLSTVILTLYNFVELYQKKLLYSQAALLQETDYTEQLLVSYLKKVNSFLML